MATSTPAANTADLRLSRAAQAPYGPGYTHGDPTILDARQATVYGRAIRRPAPGDSGVLTAAASRLTSRSISTKGGRSSTSESWQSDAWDIYDLVGEQHFLATTLANRIGQARLFIGHRSGPMTADLDEVAPGTVRVGPGTDITDLLESIGGTPSGRGQILTRMGINLFVAGDGWIVGVPRELLPENLGGIPAPTDTFGRPLTAEDLLDRSSLADLDWRMLSVSEVSIKDEHEVELRLGNGQGERITVSPDGIFLIRVWRPHPRRWWEADSPTRSSLPVLRELVGLTMHIAAQVDSRLAGAGVLVIPQSVQDMTRARAMSTGSDEDDATTAFADSLIEAMLTPIQDRDNASAVVPLVVTAPDEAVDKFKYLSFSSGLDGSAKDMREESIRRLALGQDTPPELLLGTDGMNHWGAWLVREDVVTTHIEPPLALICDALTSQYLWPLLEELGMDEETAREYAIWFDVSHLIARPNKAADAQALYTAGVVSAATLREASGFDESDAPAPQSTRERAVDLALRAVGSSPSLLATIPLPDLVAQIEATLDGADGDPTPPADVPGDDEPADPSGPPTEGTDADIEEAPRG